MKKVLITGAGSYIGTTFEKWIKENCEAIVMDTQDMRGDGWKEKDFGGYDAVFHVAGIAHADVGKVTEEQKKLYYQVNTDLAVDCARKARAEGVGQFIFMSSIIVYGDGAGSGIGKKRVITEQTPVSPANFYGDSKLRAEEGLRKLENDVFKVVILRPPMIYGKGSKGNYPMLAKMAVRLPFFPDIPNARSMLYVGNLCKFTALMIERGETGTFFPQNAEYVRTSDLAARIAAVHGRKIRLTKIFNPLIRLLGRMGGRFGGMADKAFGSLVYDEKLSEYKEEYRIYGFAESIRMTEG